MCRNSLLCGKYCSLRSSSSYDCIVSGVPHYNIWFQFRYLIFHSIDTMVYTVYSLVRSVRSSLEMSSLSSFVTSACKLGTLSLTSKPPMPGEKWLFKAPSQLKFLSQVPSMSSVAKVPAWVWICTIVLPVREGADAHLLTLFMGSRSLRS